jgi:hypothetical protein
LISGDVGDIDSDGISDTLDERPMTASASARVTFEVEHDRVSTSSARVCAHGGHRQKIPPSTHGPRHGRTLELDASCARRRRNTRIS